MKRKALMIVLCMVLVAAVSVMGTLAYLTDRESVVNTFTVGQVGIELDEALVNEQGQPIKDGEVTEPDEADRTSEGNIYHLLPGLSYVKDPTVTVGAGSEESYVRMMVTLNNYTDLKQIFGDDFLPENYASGWDRTKWIPVSGTVDETADTVTYEFRYYETVDASEKTTDIELEPLFTGFTVPGTMTGEQLALLSDDPNTDAVEPAFEITVVAHAIQAAGFAADTENNLTAEDVAWAAFEQQVK